MAGRSRSPSLQLPHRAQDSKPQSHPHMMCAVPGHMHAGSRQRVRDPQQGFTHKRSTIKQASGCVFRKHESCLPRDLTRLQHFYQRHHFSCLPNSRLCAYANQLNPHVTLNVESQLHEPDKAAAARRTRLAQGLPVLINFSKDVWAESPDLDSNCNEHFRDNSEKCLATLTATAAGKCKEKDRENPAHLAARSPALSQITTPCGHSQPSRD